MILLNVIQGLTMLLVLFMFATQLLPSSFQYVLQSLNGKVDLKNQATVMAMTVSFLSVNLAAAELMVTTLYRHDFTSNPVFLGVNLYGFAAMGGAIIFMLILTPVFKMELKWFARKMQSMKLV